MDWFHSYQHAAIATGEKAMHGVNGVGMHCMASRSCGGGALRCWLAKKAQPRQRGLLMCCRAVGLCPGLRLQEGVKGETGLAAMDPWPTGGLAGCWALADYQVSPRGPCKTADPRETLGVVRRLPPGSRFLGPGQVNGGAPSVR